MKKNNSIRAVILIAVLALTTTAALAQETAQRMEPSFDVALQLVVGSNDGGRSELPAELSGLSKQMRSRFAFSNYRLANTFIGRLSNNGNFEYKSTSNILGQESQPGAQTFLDWSLVMLRSMPAAGGKPAYQAESFRFGARVPVAGVAGGDSLKPVSMLAYEPIGITLRRVGLAEATPTLIGTLNLPGTSGTIFVVMTVRSAD